MKKHGWPARLLIPATPLFFSVSRGESTGRNPARAAIERAEVKSPFANSGLSKKPGPVARCPRMPLSVHKQGL